MRLPFIHSDPVQVVVVVRPEGLRPEGVRPGGSLRGRHAAAG